MINPLFDKEAVRNSGLLNLPFMAEFQSSPIGLIDVGARWGPSEIFKAMPEIFDVLAFEPDAEEADILEKTVGPAGGWAGFRVERTALGRDSGSRPLHILSKANNSSLLAPADHFTGRYAFRGFETVRVADVSLLPLDEVLALDGGQIAGEILKVDVQGTELDILKGAVQTLSQRTVCVICEVAFFPFYAGMPLFADVCGWLADAGFSLYGLLDTQHRSTKRLDKTQYRARERFCHADAVFLRDPLDKPQGLGGLSLRHQRVLIVAALLLGYLDLALELADAGAVPADERQGFADAVRRLAMVTTANVTSEVAALTDRIRTTPDQALVEMTRLVDRLRDFQTVHDVPQGP